MVTRIIFDTEEEDWFKCESYFKFSKQKAIHNSIKTYAKHNVKSLNHIKRCNKLITTFKFDYFKKNNKTTLNRIHNMTDDLLNVSSNICSYCSLLQFKSWVMEPPRKYYSPQERRKIFRKVISYDKI